MKIEFIANASALVTLSNDRTILFDPWYFDGAYYGSWYNFPPLVNREGYLKLKPDYIYVSHIHPDHLDPETLKHYPRETEIWLGRLPHPHLENKIRSLGFSNLKLFEMGKPEQYDGLAITVFGDFSGTSFGDPNDVDYAMDTSLYVRDQNGESIFNINDNTIQVDDAARVVAALGKPTVALVPYSGAGFYPHAFRNYTDAEKEHHKKVLTERMCDKFLEVSRILGSRWTLPVAGSYVMGGGIASYSKYLHQATPSYLRKRWAESFGEQGPQMVFLYEGDVLDTTGNSLRENGAARFRDFSEAERTEYAGTLAENMLPHELVSIPSDFAIPWPLLFARARQNLWQYQERTQIFPAADVEIHVSGAALKPFRFSLDQVDQNQAENRDASERQWIAFHLDYRLMLMILVRAAHWNNAEGGALIEVDRKPDCYHPTVHSLMSFFHL